MKRLLWIFLLLPITAHAFSPEYKRFMTSIQETIMIKTQRLSSEASKNYWKKMDEEVIGLLSQPGQDATKLNQETAPLELSVMDHDESIEMGTIQIEFVHPEGLGPDIWMAVLNNHMGPTGINTFHLYNKVGGQLQRIAALEEMKGPWELQKILTETLQIQKLPPKGGKAVFASLHSFKLQNEVKKNNRSQIVWQFDGKTLKPTLWIPQVDWHLMNEQVVDGRGEGFPL